MTNRLFMVKSPDFIKKVSDDVLKDFSHENLNIERKWYYYFMRKSGVSFTLNGTILTMFPDYRNALVYLPAVKERLKGEIVGEVKLMSDGAHNKNKRIYEMSKINMSNIYGRMGSDIMDNIRSDPYL